VLERRALEHARRGRYGRWSLRYTAPSVVAQHFQRIESTPPRFDISSEVKQHATFRRANLLRSGLRAYEQPRSFDVIFCCNVLIYMTEDAIARILANLRELLAHEGYLFLGYAESLQTAREEFDPVPAGDYLVYRRKRSSPADGGARGEGRAPVARALAPQSPSPGPATPARSAVPAVERPDHAAPPGLPSADAAYARARAEFDADHQRAALDRLDRLLETSPFHCGARLLKGYIRGSQGDFLEAATECTKVLDVDSCIAEAYLLRAMLLRQAGDAESAIGEAKKALYLEPELVLGQYLLGQLHAAQGESERARQAFANAARTLRERPELPLAVHVPFELGRDALLHQIERALEKS
jgi:tetratricopeptide (TPR) repeat protein